MSRIRIAAVVVIAATLSGCASDPYGGPKQDAGTVLGAVAGGIVGASLGRGSGRVAGAVIGATAGGILGNAIGASLDERDRQRAYEAHMRAMQSGRPGVAVEWRGPSGAYGQIVPGPPYPYEATTCREYTHTVYIHGRPQVARGVACRGPDGTWDVVS